MRISCVYVCVFGNGQKVIRFEMPFNVICLGCEEKFGIPRKIAKGVRFDAKKRFYGQYFRTKIYEFIMVCSACKQQLRVRTNPRDCTYDLAAGLRMAVNKQKDMDLREMEQDRQKARSNPFLQIETEKANLKRSKNVDQFGAFTKPISKSEINDLITYRSKVLGPRREGLREVKRIFRDRRNALREAYRSD